MNKKVNKANNDINLFIFEIKRILSSCKCTFNIPKYFNTNYPCFCRGLGLQSIAFDVIFMLQHFVWYSDHADDEEQQKLIQTREEVIV